MKKDLFEITTKARINPPISTIDLAEAFLSPAELESCVSEQNRILLKNKIAFIVTKGVLDALYDIAKPEAVNNGDIRVTKHQYFRWSSAKPIIVKKYGLTDLGYLGTRNRITGMRISSQVSDDKSHRKKFVSIIRQFKQKYPEHHVIWENCLHTIECQVDDVKSIQAELAKGA